jgi:4-amino-4-deoxy-L-arabinose transferase-like glycosyltransferase
MVKAVDSELGVLRLVYLVILATLVLLPGLGSSGRLTYHEAFVAQGAREMLASGEWRYPTIGGLPWLEKPPLPWWLVATVGYGVGMVNETVARFPSALAAMGLVIGIGTLAARHYGAHIGLLAGAIQATTAWTAIRGRLAEADILLGCVVVWAIVAFDRLRSTQTSESTVDTDIVTKVWYRWRWIFLILLGISALVKGIGFGAVLILVVVGGILVWERDGRALIQLWTPYGWALAAILALAWPLFIVAEHGQVALSLWKTHVWARLVPEEGVATFAGESLGEYTAALIAQTLPWTPFTVVGAWYSLQRALGYTYRSESYFGSRRSAGVVTGDRLLWVWAVVPLSLLTLARVRNAHYAISTQAPWSIWAALALASWATALYRAGYNRQILLRTVQIGFIALGITYGCSFWLLGPWLNRRGTEWAFYEAVGQKVPAKMHLALFYDDWDRNPYSTPFGSIPHDLAVRLFYLGRSVCWHIGPSLSWPTKHALGKCSESSLALHAPYLSETTSADGFAVIGRDQDIPVLGGVGQVEVILQGPNMRRDRMYTLFHVTPKSSEVRFARGLSMPAGDTRISE